MEDGVFEGGRSQNWVNRCPSSRRNETSEVNLVLNDHGFDAVASSQ